MIFLEVGQAACGILLPYAIKTIIDTATALDGQMAGTMWETFKDPITLFIGLNIGVLLFSRTSGTVLVILAPALRKRVRATLYHYLQNHSQRYFMGNFAGALANRVAEVSMSVNHLLWTIMFDFLPITITFAVSLTLLYGAHESLAVALASWISVYIFVSFILASKCRKYAKDFASARSAVSGKIVDAVTNIMNTRMFAHMGYERKNLDEHLTYEVKMARRQFWFMEIMRWFQFTAALGLMILMMLTALNVWTKGEITVGEFAMVMSLALMLIEQARGLARRFLEFFEYLGNINDGVNIIVQPHEVIDTQEAKAMTVTKGEIDFDDVCFSYTDGQKVFNCLNVKIPAGQKVGLVGFSGAGKSTFVNLILRFFEANSGAVKIDGQNVSTHTQDSLREGIAMIPQDPILFHRSLMENIRYGRLDATDEEVIEAAKLAKAHDFIERTPEGYNALVGERGIKLSGGQRQRIAIARAFIRNAPVLIMDEATSSLDSVTEKDIQDSLNTLMEDKTVVVVAHRLSTIANMDRILVFDNGEIIEDGSHKELLNKKGHYAKLWSMQAGGFLPE
ncbi:MAG: ABC transporter ATP-binding protein [Pseudomonadota bacterium]|nr:ABC transporter ATP-binding protein [Pseudomonadota bacterium]